MKATDFVRATDIELQPGSFFNVDGAWYMRIALKDGHRTYEAALELNTRNHGAYHHLDTSGLCLTLNPSLKFEVRVIGPLEGPGTPHTGTLVWGDESLSVATYVKDPLYVGFDGMEVNDVRARRAFFTRNWGVWIVDSDGKDVYESPLFTVNAAHSL